MPLWHKTSFLRCSLVHKESVHLSSLSIDPVRCIKEFSRAAFGSSATPHKDGLMCSFISVQLCPVSFKWGWWDAMPSSHSRLRFYFTGLCQFSKHSEDRDLSVLCCGNLKENRNDDSKAKEGFIVFLFILKLKWKSNWSLGTVNWWKWHTLW